MHQMAPEWRQILEGFDFSVGYITEFDIFEKKIIKNQKLKISKIPNAGSFMGTIGRKIQDKFQNFWQQFVGGVAFWNFNSQENF